MNKTQQALKQIAKINNSNTLNKLTLKEFKNKHLDDDKSANSKILNFLVKGPKLICKIVLYICRRYKKIFPKILDKQRLNPHKFNKMLTKLRNMF